MENAREYTWYLFAHDMHTNAVIAQAFDAGESLAHGVRCNDGVERNLWKADHALLSYLTESKKKQEVLNFEVFVKVGNGMPKRWDGFPAERLAKELHALAAHAKALKQRIRAA
jgi:hypothetical protein